MIDAIQRAHERMLSTLPVRTHEQKFRPGENLVRKGGRPLAAVNEHNRERVIDLHAKGETVLGMARHIGISRQAVRKLLIACGLR